MVLGWPWMLEKTYSLVLESLVWTLTLLALKLIQIWGIQSPSWVRASWKGCSCIPAPRQSEKLWVGSKLDTRSDKISVTESQLSFDSKPRLQEGLVFYSMDLSWSGLWAVQLLENLFNSRRATWSIYTSLKRKF